MTSTSTSQPVERRLTPSRIRLARERRGLSKVTLATELGITPRSLQNYETAGAPLGQATKLAAALGVDPSFFYRPERVAPSADQGFFRARRKANAAQLSAARAAASIGIELYEWIGERFALPVAELPELDHHAPESAAAALRAAWGRNDDPLPNLIQLSESFGVRVLSLPTDADTVDAFSMWFDGVPYVFLSTAKSAERSRFDLAHELGHLVLHSRTDVDSIDHHTRAIEREADIFAACFLMPAPSVLAHGGREPAVPQIIQLRDYYRVSAIAMTHRLHELDRLSDWAYRQNCAELTRRGFRVSEPGGLMRERSRIFATIFPALRAQGIRADDLATELGIHLGELHGLTFGHAPVMVTSSGDHESDERAALHLVR